VSDYSRAHTCFDVFLGGFVGQFPRSGQEEKMRVFLLAGIALAIAAGPSCAFAQTGTTVVVLNYTGASRAMLHAASESARLAFLAAGVETRWQIAEDPSAPTSTAGLQVFVMTKPRQSAERASGFLSAGSALLNPAYPRAYAFLDAVTAVSQRTTRPESAILACIFVHEIGHLLGLSHGKRGAMRADLDPIEIDNVLRGRAFDAHQARILRAALTSPPPPPSRIQDPPALPSIASHR